MNTEDFRFAPLSFAESASRRSTLLAEFAISGLGAKEFARNNNIPERTFRRYRRAAEKRGRSGLGDRRFLNGGRPAQNVEQHLGWVCCYLANFPQAPLTVAHEELIKVCDREKWPSVEYRTLLRAYESLSEDVKVRLRAGYESVYKKAAIVGRRESAKLLDLCQFDCTELDLWCLDMRDGSIFRPWASALIETKSRVVMAACLHRSVPDREEALLALRKGLLPKKQAAHPFWGAPRQIQTDNAAIYKYSEIKRSALLIDCDWIHIPKRKSSANGKIERAFGTINTRFLSTLPGYANRYAGKYVAEKEGVIPWPVLQSILDRYVGSYNTTKHSVIECSPWEMWHASLDEVEPHRFDVHSIDQAFRMVHKVEVTRTGLPIDGKRYDGGCLAGCIGHQVTVFTLPGEIEDRLPVFYKGEKLGTVSIRIGDPEIADEINQARHARASDLTDFTRKMRAKLSENPPKEVHETVTPSEWEQVSSNRKARKSTSSKPKVPKFAKESKS